MWPLLLFAGIGGVYLFLRSVYRVFFHPLRKFPGPKLAAITHGVEFYHDVIRNGRYLWEIERMHQRYGPIVRINPRELHIKDPHYYDEIYASASRRREKDPKFVGVFGFPTSMIATTGHDLHRFRRGLLNNFFSKKSVLQLSPILHEKEVRLIQRFKKAYEDNSILKLDDAFAALTADLISQYSWGVSTDFLKDDNFKNDIRQALNEISVFVHVNRFFPILSTILRALPRWVLGKLRPGATAILDMQDTVAQQSSNQNDKPKGSRTTIFDALCDPNVPSDERSPSRIEDEGLIVVVAGTETTARTLTLAAFHLYQNKPMLLRLREELRQVMPTPATEASWPQLEALPYMNGVVNEAIRLSYGPIFRSTRVAPTESLKYRDHTIPPGSPVSMSSYFVLMDPEVFPDPKDFQPERWIRAAEQGHNLGKFLVSFTRGSRICLGMNLAYAELYRTIAGFVRLFDMELYETSFDDIRVDRELGIGQPKAGDFSVRVKITNVLED